MICKKCGKENRNNSEYCSKCQNDILTEINQKIMETPDNVQLYFERAKFYRELHDEENAILDYKKILEIEPDNIEAYYICTMLKCGEYEEVKNFVEKILEKDPQNTIAFAYRGFCNSELGCREDAVKDFDKAFELEPNQEKIHELLQDCIDPGTRAWVYINFVKRNPKDISAYKREIYALHDCCIENNSFLDSKFCNCRERLYSSNNIDFGKDAGKINRLKEECYKILNQNDNEINIENDPVLCEFEFDDIPEELSYKECLDSVDDYYESKNYQAAIGIINAYLNAYPQIEEDENELYLKRGICYYKMANYKKALQDFNKLINLGGRNRYSIGYLYRGLVYIEKNEYKKAYNDFEKSEQYLRDSDYESTFALEINMAKSFAIILMEK